MVAPINRTSPPYALYFLIGFVLLFGVPGGQFYFWRIVQAWLAFRLMSALAGWLRGRQRPRTLAPPPRRQAGNYVSQTGDVMSEALPHLDSKRMALALLAACTLGGLFESISVPMFSLLPRRLVGALPGMLPSALLIVLGGCEHVLHTAPAWLPRAFGAAIAAKCVGARLPFSSAPLWPVFGWAATASLLVELHGRPLWLQLAAPVLMRLLGYVGVRLVTSSLTLPAIALLTPAAASCVGLARHDRPVGPARRDGSSRSRLAPLLLLAALYFGGVSIHVAQDPARLDLARTLATNVARADWRAVRATLHRALPRPPPPPPLSSLSPEDAESHALHTLGVARGAHFDEVRPSRAVRHLLRTRAWERPYTLDSGRASRYGMCTRTRGPPAI